MDAALREQLLARFTQLLDTALADEPLPEGFPPELAPGAPAAPDLFTVVSALTSLTQEVKLQGRAFQGLQEAVQPLAAERTRTADREAVRRVERDHLELLVDLRERLRRGLEGSRDHRERLAALPRPSWLARALGGGGERHAALVAATEALAGGEELALARLDEALRRRGLSELACVGRPFDPHRMVAVELARTAEAAEGTVVEVLRPGYELDGETFRAAEVRVARPPEGGAAERGGGT